MLPQVLTVSKEVEQGVVEVIIKLGEVIILVCNHRVGPTGDELHLWAQHIRLSTAQHNAACNAARSMA
jgi:hypothetical protein